MREHLSYVICARAHLLKYIKGFVAAGLFINLENGSLVFAKFLSTNSLGLRYFNDCIRNFCEICIIAEMQRATRFTIFGNYSMSFVFFSFSKFRSSNYLHLRYYDA